jgi:hypothetical protein
MLVPLIAQYRFVWPLHEALPVGMPPLFVDPRLVELLEQTDQIASLALPC